MNSYESSKPTRNPHINLLNHEGIKKYFMNLNNNKSMLFLKIKALHKKSLEVFCSVVVLTLDSHLGDLGSIPWQGTFCFDKVIDFVK